MNKIIGKPASSHTQNSSKSQARSTYKHVLRPVRNPSTNLQKHIKTDRFQKDQMFFNIFLHGQERTCYKISKPVNQEPPCMTDSIDKKSEENNQLKQENKN
ncbi:hypothetical protein RYX36_010921 [Vicia faba]